MVSHIDLEAQYRLKDQELGQGAMFRTEKHFLHISRHNPVASGLLRGRVDACMYKKGLSKTFAYLSNHNCLNGTTDRLNQAWRYPSWHGAGRKQLASDLLQTQKVLEAISLPNLISFFTTEFLEALDSFSIWI